MAFVAQLAERKLLSIMSLILTEGLGVVFFATGLDWVIEKFGHFSLQVIELYKCQNYSWYILHNGSVMF